MAANASAGSVPYDPSGGASGGAVHVVALDDEATLTTGDPNVTIPCRNDYCVSDEAYVDMIWTYLSPSVFEWVVIAFYIVVFVVGVIGNALVCYVVWRNLYMRTVTNLFIVNLSAADLMVIVLCLPPTVFEDVAQTFLLGTIMCKIVKYAQNVSISVSVLTLTVISVERYYAICHPLKMKSTTNRARFMILIIWSVSMIINIPEVIANDLHSPLHTPGVTVLLTHCKPAWSDASKHTVTFFLLIALYILPLCLMGYAYTSIAVCLWSTKIPTETDRCNPLNNSQSRSAAAHQLANRRKVAKMLIAVVIMFMLCYLPVHLMNILRYMDVLQDTKNPVVITNIALVAHWLCYLNSAINPLIYNFMSAKFRKEFFQSCRCFATCLFYIRLPFSGDTRSDRWAPSSYRDSACNYHYANDTETITMNTMATKDGEDTVDEYD